MFPVADFNFFVAGIATFAASVGYACGRRLSMSLSNSNQSQTTVREGGDKTLSSKETLKRKIPHDGFDEPERPSSQELGYPHNLANIYPNKRSRTPSTEASTDESEDATPSFAPMPNHLTAIPTLDSMASESADVVLTPPSEEMMTTPAPEPPRTPSPPTESTLPQPPSPVVAQAAPVFAAPPVVTAAVESAPIVSSTPVLTQVTPPARTVTPRPITGNRNPFGSPASGGFAAFAGSASPFSSSFNKPAPGQNASPFSSSAGRSIWSTPNDVTTDKEDVPTNSVNDHALEEAKTKIGLGTEKYTHITGEENEDVEMELKGVKLFTKRGSKSFTEGVVGHVKLLSNRTTLEERILFRREPLWKVSMNVRVQASIRCSYVPEENVLRMILKESSGAGKEADELVIYALKPGRSCSKQDFKDFAEALIKIPQLRPGASAGVKSALPNTSSPSLS